MVTDVIGGGERVSGAPLKVRIGKKRGKTAGFVAHTSWFEAFFFVCVVDSG